MLKKLTGSIIDLATKSRESRIVGSYDDMVAKKLSRASGGDEADILSVMRGEKEISTLSDKDTGTTLESIIKRRNEGTFSTEEAVGSMYQNVKDSGSVFGGLSNAGQTKSNALGFSAFGNPDNILGSIGMGAFVGAGASSIAGGDVSEGAFLGGLAGAAGSVGAKVFRESLGAMEESVMKKALGGDFKTKDLMQYPTKKVPARFGSGTYTTSKLKQTARGRNLDAIGKIDLKDAPESMNFLDKQVVKQMQNKESASMGVQSRFATMSGAALAGMAFTSSAGSDKRRGFNRNRGNRV